MRVLMLVFLCGSLFSQTPPQGERKQPDPRTLPKFFLYDPNSGAPQAPKDQAPYFNVNPDLWKKFLENQQGSKAPVRPEVQGGRTVVLKQNQPCAIPLTNVLKPSSRPEPMIRPTPPPEQFPIRQVPLPAPSCDDVKR